MTSLSNQPLSTLTASPGELLSQESIQESFFSSLGSLMPGGRVLVLIPDHTRSLPLPSLFRTVVEALPSQKQLDFMVALGTHPPLGDADLLKLVGLSPVERNKQYSQIRLLNHSWEDSTALTQIGMISEDKIRQIAGNHWHPSLPNEVPVRINKMVLDYDHIIILGPVFPHEVVGFSGGAKYLFPGISGPEMINATHWLGALAGVVGTIGIKETPVRAMIHAAAEKLSVPVTLIALVVEHDGLAGLFIGDYLEGWKAAADLSAQRHIYWVEKPYQCVLSCAPTMYDELWTAAKAMYKLEPAVALGGEVIIYAPHLDTISHVHGKYIYEIGYHILPYFLRDWERFKHVPLGVLAHSTHVRGSGVMEKGIEKPNVKVTLASKVSPEDCKRLNLGYRDPATINPGDFADRENEGVLYVPKAGEILYRLKQPGT